MSELNLLPEFSQAVATQQTRVSGKVESYTQPTRSVRTTAYTDEDVLAAATQRQQEIEATVTEAVTADFTPPFASLHRRNALLYQADQLSVLYRAKVMRHTSYARRLIHNTGRRAAHTGPGGYFERRVLNPAVVSLVAASEAENR